MVRETSLQKAKERNICEILSQVTVFLDEPGDHPLGEGHNFPKHPSRSFPSALGPLFSGGWVELFSAALYSDKEQHGMGEVNFIITLISTIKI